MEYQNTLSFAQQLDQNDKLGDLRNQYLFPQHDGKNVIYFTGNSLGLQPRGVKEALLRELNDWASFGVEGHFLAQNPWFSYHEQFTEGSAALVGALPHEVVVMNQLTVNLHLLLISFYRPEGKRRKILFETKPFPSDQYAFESHALLHGFELGDVLVEMQPRPGEVTLRTEDILNKINELGDELALVCFGAVNYFTGQFFDLQAITSSAHAVGAMCGFDLAHAAGNLPLSLHTWDVDFACWCSYKYLNSGPGGVSGVYIHERHARNKKLLRLAGWWGNDKTSRFKMDAHFEPTDSAEAWQLSNAPILSMAAHKVALDIFTATGMKKLREKSILLTGYLQFILEEIQKKTGQSLLILTPSDPSQRGCQLSVVIHGRNRSVITALAEEGVIADWREPDVIRLAPVPMYNSFEDVYRFGAIFEQILSH